MKPLDEWSGKHGRNPLKPAFIPRSILDLLACTAIGMPLFRLGAKTEMKINSYLYCPPVGSFKHGPIELFIATAMSGFEQVVNTFLPSY